MNPADALFGPFFAQIILTFLVWVYMYARRIPFLQSIDLEPDEITPAQLSELSPPAVANPSDNLKNLFEMPVLFFALIFYFHSTGHSSALVVGLAWGFVLFRALHSVVHATFNRVLLRFGLYLVASICLWAMAAIGALGYFTA